MNYDPVRFCYHCQRPKRRETFVPIPGPRKRQICGDCAEERAKREAEIKARPV